MRALAFGIAALVACGDNVTVVPDAPATAPPLRNAVALPDDELAERAFAELAACARCHGLTKPTLRAWRGLTDDALATCFTDPTVATPASARATIACLRAMPGGDFATKRLGVFASAVRLPWFAYLFEVAGEPIDELVDQVAMPRGDDRPSFGQAQFDLVAEWFVRGLPELDRVVVDPPPPATCVAAIAPAVGAHVTAMATLGWAALNAQRGLAMHDVSGAPALPAWGASVRVLRALPYVTSFWTRSSADGRFVAHGVASVPGSYVVDLQRDATIAIDADYDPAFFPDHAGFAFHGGPRNTCAIGVLTSNPPAIAMTEPGCRAISSLGLYESLGASPTDYVAVDSLFVSDDGGKLPTVADPATAFPSTSTLSILPMTFDGSQFVPGTPRAIATPFEGDAVVAPSGRIVITRLSGPDDRQLGFVLRTIDGVELARYCATGGKPAFTFDERYVVFHRYRGDAAADVYLLELATGIEQRITTLPAGHYALFPHARSDGWIYAVVRAPDGERLIASDAAHL